MNITNETQVRFNYCASLEAYDNATKDEGAFYIVNTDNGILYYLGTILLNGVLIKQW